MKKAAVFLADGFEEVEALTQIDLLRRAGIDVKIVAVGEETLVKGAHNIGIMADEGFNYDSLLAFDAIVLPGGMPGTENLYNFAPLKNLINRFNDEGKVIAAICAAPSVFGRMGLLNGKKACCYPGFEGYLKGAVVETGSVSRDGNVITSRGVGTAIDFAAEIIKSLLNAETADRVLREIIYRP